MRERLLDSVLLSDRSLSRWAVNHDEHRESGVCLGNRAQSAERLLHVGADTGGVEEIPEDDNDPTVIAKREKPSGS